MRFISSLIENVILLWTLHKNKGKEKHPEIEPQREIHLAGGNVWISHALLSEMNRDLNSAGDAV